VTGSSGDTDASHTRGARDGPRRGGRRGGQGLGSFRSRVEEEEEDDYFNQDDDDEALHGPPPPCYAAQPSSQETKHKQNKDKESKEKDPEAPMGLAALGTSCSFPPPHLSVCLARGRSVVGKRGELGASGGIGVCCLPACGAPYCLCLRLCLGGVHSYHRVKARVVATRGGEGLMGAFLRGRDGCSSDTCCFAGEYDDEEETDASPAANKREDPHDASPDTRDAKRTRI